MMEWIPIILVTFKILVLGTGMFFAIKWHYDKAKKGKNTAKEARAVLRASSKVFAAFTLLLLGLGLITYVVARTSGLEMTFM